MDKLTYIKLSSSKSGKKHPSFPTNTNPDNSEIYDDLAPDFIEKGKDEAPRKEEAPIVTEVLEDEVSKKVQTNNEKYQDIDLEPEIIPEPQAKEEKVTSSFPSFLSKLQSGITHNTQTKGADPNRSLALITEGEKKINPNSFGSIFSKDHDEIDGVQRVFKKSIAFLVINLAIFGILTLMSVNLFSVPVIAIVITSVAFMTVVNIFFIIVADRSYVWLSISGQIILLLLVHSFLGEGFNPITLFAAFLLAVLIFSAYSELEKIQLGSRLFFISHITGETTRIMSTAVAIVMALGLFSSMISQTPAEFVRKHFLGSTFIKDNILVGSSPRLSLNSLFIKSNQLFGEGNEKATFRDFLTRNYKLNQSILTEAEENDIVINCETRESGSTTSDCLSIVASEKDKRLQEWRRVAYPRINYSLDTVIKKEEFDQLVSEHYIYLINDISNSEATVIPIPNVYIIPGVFAVSLFIFLVLIKVFINWIVYLCTWILWKILRWIGFAKIEIEAVEAEIVSI